MNQFQSPQQDEDAEYAAYLQEQEDAAWEAEQAQVRWGEAGGYRAGLSRPAY